MQHKIAAAVVAVALFATSDASAAGGWIARCEEPNGPRVNYGWMLMPDGSVKQSPDDGAVVVDDGFSNVYPVFIYRGPGSRVVEYVWGHTRPDEVDPSVFETPDTKRAAIITQRPELVATAELFPPAERWLTSFYPKVGVVFATRHRTPAHFHEKSNVVSAATYVMACEFSPL